MVDSTVLRLWMARMAFAGLCPQAAELDQRKPDFLVVFSEKCHLLCSKRHGVSPQMNQCILV